MTTVVPPRSAADHYYRFTAYQMGAGTADRFRAQLQQFGVNMDGLAEQHRTWISSGQTTAKPSLNIYNSAPQPAPTTPQDPADAAAAVNAAMARLSDVGYGASRMLHDQVDWLEDRPDPASLVREPITGTDGDDVVHAYFGAMTGGTGAGNDTIYSYSNAGIDAGDGNDKLVHYGNGTIQMGSGDDLALMHGGTVYGGEGQDQFTLLGRGGAHGGVGDDRFLVMKGGHAYGDEGNDHIEMVADSWGYGGRADGGDGNDTIIAHGGGWLTGGAGNDILTVTGRGDSWFNGGTGDDTLTVGKFSKVHYELGDGHDVISGEYGGAQSDGLIHAVGYTKADGTYVPPPPPIKLPFPVYYGVMDLTLGEGIQREQVQAERVGNDVRISFAGAEGSITLKDYQGGPLQAKLAGGGKVDIRALLGPAPPAPEPEPAPETTPEPTA